MATMQAFGMSVDRCNNLEAMGKLDPKDYWTQHEEFYEEHKARLQAKLYPESKETPPKLDYPKYEFKQYLVKGMRNYDVKMLQQVLIAEGFLKNGLDTGYFWNLTEQGVKDFQAKWGITIVGKVGPITRAKLSELCK